jgi:hypothetical protein
MRKKHLVLGASIFLICTVAGIGLYWWFSTPPEDWVLPDPYECPEKPDNRAWIAVEPGETPITNPLKGFMPYAGDYDTFPYSMEYTYFSVREIAGNSIGLFNFTPVETMLNEIAGRGHQAVFRFYFDYPGEPTGMPQFLIDAGVPMRHYKDFGGGYSPDYDHPLMVAEMLTLIEALGQSYDGDPRVGFIQTGLLGKWGEWHTYPDEDWMANETTQRTVLAAFENAFSSTQFLTRYPTEITQDYRVGYHDDSFAFATLPETGDEDEDWYFWVQMAAMGMTDIWQTVPIGGEVRPEIQAKVFYDHGFQGQNFLKCVYTTHASWMLMSAVFWPDEYDYGHMNPDDLARAADGSRHMGYDFRACWVLPEYNAISKQLNATVVISNKGVAPFYYNWTIDFGILDRENNPLVIIKSNQTIGGLLPGDTKVYAESLDNIHLENYSNCSVAIRVPNVLDGGMPIRFSNAVVSSDGWVSLFSLSNIL